MQPQRVVVLMDNQYIFRPMSTKALILALLCTLCITSLALRLGPPARSGDISTCKRDSPVFQKGRLAAALGSFFLSFSAISPPAFAAGNYLSYTNSRFHTSLDYPADYEQKVGTLSGERTVVAFTDPKDPDTSASLVFTPIAADFARLSSFGGKDTLRGYLLPSGDGVEASVVSENVKGESYSLEYTVSAPGAPTRHIQSVFALRSQEAIVALVVQTKEESYAANKAKLEAIAPSLNVDLP